MNKFFLEIVLIAFTTIGLSISQENMAVPINDQIDTAFQSFDKKNTSEGTKSTKIDSLLIPGHKKKEDSTVVVRHQFNHKEQVITGGVIMACIALMLVTMNNYNPQ